MHTSLLLAVLIGLVAMVVLELAFIIYALAILVHRQHTEERSTSTARFID